MKINLLMIFLFITQLLSATGNRFLIPSATPAGDTPVIFFPNSVAREYSVRDMAISPSGHEMFFTILGPDGSGMFILYAKWNGTNWSAPAMAPFSGQYGDLEPAFSPDGQRLFFVSNRPLTPDGSPKDFDIWYVDFKNGKWSPPVSAGTSVNSALNEFYPAVTRSGNLYFTAAYKDSKGKEDIYISEWKNGNYQTPVSLSAAVNSDTYEFNAYVSPDEQLIIFSSQGRADDLGGGDLYSSQKDSSGNWKPAVHWPAPFNSDRLDYCPFITADQKEFYFTSSRGIIPEKQQTPLTLPAYLLLLHQPLNGKGNLYKVSMTPVNRIISSR